jgi:hypothetical protein
MASPSKYRGELEPVPEAYWLGAGHRWCHLVSYVSHLARSHFTRVLRKSGKRPRLFLRRHRPFRRDDVRAPDPTFREHDCRLLQRPHHSLSRQRPRTLQEGPRDRRVDERGARARHDRRRRGARLAGIAEEKPRSFRSPKAVCTKLAWKIPNCEPRHSSEAAPGLYEGRQGLQGLREL